MNRRGTNGNLDKQNRNTLCTCIKYYHGSHYYIELIMLIKILLKAVSENKQMLTR